MALDKAKLKGLAQVGIPTKKHLTDVGCTDQEADALVQFQSRGSFNWQAILQLLAQYGPQFLQIILALLNPTPPAPTPAP